MKCLNLGRQLQALLLKGRENRVNIRFFNGRGITLAHAEIECIDGGSELRDGEDDHDIRNDDKLEGNSSSNCDFSYFKYKAYFLMFEDNGSHCKNIIGGIVEEFSRGVGWGEFIR